MGCWEFEMKFGFDVMLDRDFEIFLVIVWINFVQKGNIVCFFVL